MFGFRADGHKVKGLKLIERAEPYFMPQRIDAANILTVDIDYASIQNFIVSQNQLGHSYNVMDVVIATIVRILYIRKQLNRFIMRGVIYQRNEITISLDIKKEMSDEGESVTLKMHFTGRENLDEIKAIVDNEISKSMQADNMHKTTKFVNAINFLPNFLFRWAIKTLWWLDVHGMLPYSVLDCSPFHTSCFLTNLKSIRLQVINHHLYNFGTTTMFIAMGKEKMEPIVVDNKEVGMAKIMKLGITLDERVADGYYMAKTLRLLKDLLANPAVLLERPEEDNSDLTKRQLKKLMKKRKKEQKKLEKENKKS